MWSDVLQERLAREAASKAAMAAQLQQAAQKAAAEKAAAAEQLRAQQEAERQMLEVRGRGCCFYCTLRWEHVHFYCT